MNQHKIFITEDQDRCSSYSVHGRPLRCLWRLRLNEDYFWFRLGNPVLKSIWSPLSSRSLHRPLSVDDVGCPSEVRSVGRVVQAFPDGTLLLELNRPSGGPFGFLISRGKGRPDSGPTAYIAYILLLWFEWLWASLFFTYAESIGPLTFL